MFKTHVLEPEILYHDSNFRGAQFSFLFTCIETVLDQVYCYQWLHPKKTSCSITVMLFRIIKIFNISSAVCY